MPRGAKSRMHRNETPKPIWIKLCVVVDIPDVVAYTNCGDNRLRVFGWRGSNFPFLVRYYRRPYKLPHFSHISAKLPESEHIAGDGCVCVVKIVITDCSPDSSVANLQTSSVKRTVAAGKSNRHVV